jgi:hypothetical protein
VYFVQFDCLAGCYRDKKVVGVFVRFRAPFNEAHEILEKPPYQTRNRCTNASILMVGWEAQGKFINIQDFVQKRVDKRH